MDKDVLDRIEVTLKQIAEDLHAMRKAQAAELKLILAMLPPQQEEEDPVIMPVRQTTTSPVQYRDAWGHWLPPGVMPDNAVTATTAAYVKTEEEMDG